MDATISDCSIKKALSASRIETYENAIDDISRLDDAIKLYAWNARISAAFLDPLHVCEVVVRNAVAEALNVTYGSRWPWEMTFERSLPEAAGPAFSARRELINVRRKRQNISSGKIIADLKFKFWETMFTQRFDTRIWSKSIRSVFPYLPSGFAIHEARREIHDSLVLLRGLRNRIAHHEPIFKRALSMDFQKTRELISYRCPVTSAWMTRNQQVTALIAVRPMTA